MVTQARVEPGLPYHHQARRRRRGGPAILACLLLVAYHVIGAGPLHGMRLPSDDLLPVLSRVFSDIRMPMFAFISGFVFAGYTGGFGAVSSAMAKKSRRLLIPLVAVSTLHYLVQAAALLRQKRR